MSRERRPTIAAREDAWELAREFAPRLREGQFYSHDFALALFGAPTPTGWTPTVHVSAHRPQQAPRVRGVLGHRLRARHPAWTDVRGLPVESPARAWAQAAFRWAPDDLIASGDFLVARRRPLATIAEIQAEAIRARGQEWARLVEEIRVGSESPRETRLRLVLVRAGLPEPELNVELRDSTGSFVARSDLLYRAFRVAVEYDGRQHATDIHQFARDADRWDAIRALGWEHVRILDHHLFPDPSRAVEKVAAALRRGGWAP